ncbi:hypothetical protein L0152_31575, partial [bacterium]|nr:hypothetical protein [bacterium]
IAVQQAVPRQILGTATSLNQFSRSIGGAVGVAIMGAFLSAGLASNLQKAALNPMAIITPQQATELAANPNALIEPSSRAAMSSDMLYLLQSALSAALRNVFLVGMIMSAIALFIVFRLPQKIAARADQVPMPPPAKACEAQSGERMVIAELATIDADHEPAAVDEE